MSESTLAVANYFLRKLPGEISPMKLLKLVYISHGWHLALTDQPLVGEDIQAWKYGPVIASLYQRFRDYGNGAIPSPPADPEFNNPKVASLLNSVWDGYRKFTATQLSSMTHAEGTPWFETWENGGKHILGAVIPESLIKKHYKEKLAKIRNGPK